MAAKSGGYYRKLHVDKADHSQAVDMVPRNIGEANAEEFTDVFADDESRNEQLDSRMPRKRSVLKRDSVQNFSQRIGALKKQVSFSAVPSERRRRVSNGMFSSALLFFKRLLQQKESILRVSLSSFIWLHSMRESPCRGVDLVSFKNCGKLTHG